MKKSFKLIFPKGSNPASEAVVLSLFCGAFAKVIDLGGQEVEVEVDDKNENWSKFFNNAPSGVTITPIVEDKK